MPNWCNNNVTISGPEKKLKALSKAAEGGELFNFMYPRSKDLDITAGFVGPDDSAEQNLCVSKRRMKRSTATKTGTIGQLIVGEPNGI